MLNPLSLASLLMSGYAIWRINVMAGTVEQELSRIDTFTNDIAEDYRTLAAQIRNLEGANATEKERIAGLVEGRANVLQQVAATVENSVPPAPEPLPPA